MDFCCCLVAFSVFFSGVGFIWMVGFGGFVVVVGVSNI